MPIDITIPSPGESVTDVTLGQWHKRSGEWVSKDEPLVEIESDKVTLEVVAPETGLLNVTADSGAEKKVGDKIGSVDPSANPPAGTSGNGAASSSSTTPPSTLASSRQPAPTAPAPDHAARSAAVNEAATEVASGGRATSVARKLAADKGVDLSKLQGTGPSGRVRKSDVMAATSSSPSPSGRGQGEGEASIALRPPRPAASSSPLIKQQTVVSLSGPGHRGVRREKMSKLRQRIAQRLVEAQHNAAMLTTFNECDMTEIMRLRSLHKEDFEKRHGIGLGFMSFFVRACASALAAFPRVNAYIVPASSPSPSGGGRGQGEGGTEIEYHDFADISVAVGTDKGLVVPVLRNAELMSFAGIELTIKDLATRAREGKLTLEEMTGGTFTITNGGIFGSLNSTPILNPPQSAILGMHAIKKRPVEHPKDSGAIALRPMMYLALSYDHRIVDGAEAVSFLVHVKNAIETPERMLLGL